MKLSKSIPRLKSEAKETSKRLGISRSEALNQIAKREGFSSWSLLSQKSREYEEESRTAQIPKQITELPLTGSLRREAISVAKSSFARALGRMEARNPRRAKKYWSAEEYVDRTITADMLPIDTEYALHLIEVFLVMDAVNAAVDADHT